MEEIISFFESILGLGKEEFAIKHVVARSFCIYLIGIFLVRLGNRRFAAKMSAFDIILAIIIGSLLSRAVTEKDLFVEIVVACVGLIILHRLFSFIAARSHQFGLIIKGTDMIIVENGKIQWEKMRKSNTSENDLMQALRMNTNTDEIKNIKVARIERDGNISFSMESKED